MKERVGALLGGVAEGMPWLGTFHSIGTKILRRHAELVGLKSDFTILDTDDQLRLMKQVIEAEDIDEKRWPARQLAAMIDGWKNRGLDARQGAAGRGRRLRQRQGRRALRRLSGAAEDAQRRRFRRPPARMPAALRASNPTCSAIYQQRFRYILVDEYQDTNVAQYLWLRLLAQAPPQPRAASATTTSRSMAGAAPRSTTSCASSTTFPAPTVIRLERNYRSTGHILAAASHLIAHNEGRLGKTLFTEDELGEKVDVTGAWDREEEARLIGEEIEALHAKRHSPRRDGDPGAHLRPDARVRGPLRHARPALPRHRRPALLRARRDPRRARLSARVSQPGRRPRLRAHRQRAEARPRRRDARSCCTTTPARAACR